jgi:hypothetical protein
MTSKICMTEQYLKAGRKPRLIRLAVVEPSVMTERVVEIVSPIRQPDGPSFSHQVRRREPVEAIEHPTNCSGFGSTKSCFPVPYGYSGPKLSGIRLQEAEREWLSSMLTS